MGQFGIILTGKMTEIWLFFQKNPKKTWEEARIFQIFPDFFSKKVKVEPKKK